MLSQESPVRYLANPPRHVRNSCESAAENFAVGVLRDPDLCCLLVKTHGCAQIPIALPLDALPSSVVQLSSKGGFRGQPALIVG